MRKLGMSVTTHGSIIVLSISRNRALRNGKWNRAKPYATSAALDSSPTIASVVTKTEFRIIAPNGSAFHASPKLRQDTGSGITLGGKTNSWPGVLSAVDSIQMKGMSANRAPTASSA
jgi:hypothetical protein